VKPFHYNIIAIGGWNKKIFSPAWVQSFLFKDSFPPVEVVGVYDMEEQEIAFSYGGILMLPKNNSLELRLQDETVNSLKMGEATNILNKILELLPHTPIKGIGFNVKYKIPVKSNSSLINHCNTNFAGGFGEFKISQIKQTIDKGNYKINMFVSLLDSDYYELNFNFHYNSIPKFSESCFYDHIIEAEKIISYEN
jgi:hypothetical protein